MRKDLKTEINFSNINKDEFKVAKDLKILSEIFINELLDFIVHVSKDFKYQNINMNELANSIQETFDDFLKTKNFSTMVQKEYHNIQNYNSFLIKIQENKEKYPLPNDIFKEYINPSNSINKQISNYYHKNSFINNILSESKTLSLSPILIDLLPEEAYNLFENNFQINNLNDIYLFLKNLELNNEESSTQILLKEYTLFHYKKTNFLLSSQFLENKEYYNYSLLYKSFFLSTLTEIGDKEFIKFFKKSSPKDILNYVSTHKSNYDFIKKFIKNINDICSTHSFNEHFNILNLIYHKSVDKKDLLSPLNIDSLINDIHNQNTKFSISQEYLQPNKNLLYLLDKHSLSIDKSLFIPLFEKYKKELGDSFDYSNNIQFKTNHIFGYQFAKFIYLEELFYKKNKTIENIDLILTENNSIKSIVIPSSLIEKVIGTPNLTDMKYPKTLSNNNNQEQSYFSLDKLKNTDFYSFTINVQDVCLLDDNSIIKIFLKNLDTTISYDSNDFGAKFIADTKEQILILKTSKHIVNSLPRKKI